MTFRLSCILCLSVLSLAACDNPETAGTPGTLFPDGFLDSRNNTRDSGGSVDTDGGEQPDLSNDSQVADLGLDLTEGDLTGADITVEDAGTADVSGTDVESEDTQVAEDLAIADSVEEVSESDVEAGVDVAVEDASGEDQANADDTASDLGFDDPDVENPDLTVIPDVIDDPDVENPDLTTGSDAFDAFDDPDTVTADLDGSGSDMSDTSSMDVLADMDMGSSGDMDVTQDLGDEVDGGFQCSIPEFTEYYGTFESESQRGAVVGAYFYEFNAGDIAIYEIDEEGLTYVSTSQNIYAAASINDTFVIGNTLYVLDYGGSLFVLDVATPTAPVVVGSHSFGNSLTGIELFGTLAYVSSRSGDIYALEISNPSNILELGSWDGGGDPQDLQVFGSTVYVAQPGGAVQVVDFDDPSNAMLMFEINPPELTNTVRSVRLVGDYLLAGTGRDGTGVIYPGNAFSPSQDDAKLIGVIEDVGYIYGLAIADDLLFASGGSTVSVFDIGDVAHPHHVGSYGEYDFSGETNTRPVALEGAVVIMNSNTEDGSEMVYQPLTDCLSCDEGYVLDLENECIETLLIENFEGATDNWTLGTEAAIESTDDDFELHHSANSGECTSTTSTADIQVQIPSWARAIVFEGSVQLNSEEATGLFGFSLTSRSLLPMESDLSQQYSYCIESDVVGAGVTMSFSTSFDGSCAEIIGGDAWWDDIYLTADGFGCVHNVSIK
ncbi:MAG: hypothetical protein KC561_05855 [Myxococcales bacterium]|nr:hypothetical protein [Myxococcales bacterium]